MTKQTDLKTQFKNSGILRYYIPLLMLVFFQQYLAFMDAVHQDMIEYFYDCGIIGISLMSVLLLIASFLKLIRFYKAVGFFRKSIIIAIPLIVFISSVSLMTYKYYSYKTFTGTEQYMQQNTLTTHSLFKGDVINKKLDRVNSETFKSVKDRRKKESTILINERAELYNLVRD
jgi:hypothetical protein